MSCLVISCFILKSLTSLSFQVPCPSSCVKCLIVFPDSQSVSTCSPWLLLCSNSLRFPCLVPVCCASVLSLILASLIHSFHSHGFLEPAVERSSCRAYPLFCKLFHSFSLNHGKFHSLVLFLHFLERFLIC